MADTAQNISAVQMYTINGQVKDGNIINAFVKKYVFAPPSNAKPFEINPFIINIKNDIDATVIASIGYKVDTSNYSFLSKSSSGFVLRAPDSTSTIFHLGTGDITTDATSLFEVEYSKGCYIPVNSATGYGGPCYYRPAIQFDIKGSQIYLPYFSCQLSQNIYHYNAIYNIQGDFNTQITRHLTTGDTLIVQTKNFLLVKK